jgi:hypothetical protein
MPKEMSKKKKEKPDIFKAELNSVYNIRHDYNKMIQKG